MSDYLTQSETPLYEKILWNKPLTRQGAGNLLLIGGKTGSFSNLQSFFVLSQAAGIGRTRLVLPDSLSRVVGSIDQVFYVPSTPSGSLARAGLSHILELASDYDALVLGDDIGRNSETTIMLEAIVSQTDKPLIIFGEALAGLKFQALRLLQRPRTLLILDMLEAFKLAGAARLGIPVHKSGGPTAKVAAIDALAQPEGADLALVEHEVIIASSGQISLTANTAKGSWINPLLCTFWVQNLAKPFEGLTTAAFLVRSIQPPNLTVDQAAGAIEQTLKKYL